MWSGSLNFGLVTIPVKLYSAIENHDVSLHQVHAADGGRIRYHRVCEVCGQEIGMRDIARSFESDEGERVMLTDDDFASLPADRSKQISVEQFAPADQIDPLLFDRSYYLEPSKSAAKAYALLRSTLERTDRVAIVQFALRQRTQLGVLRVHDEVMAVQTLRWPDEVRAFELPDQVQGQQATKREMDMAETLVSSYSSDFEPDEFTDAYRDELQSLIETKLEGGEGFTAPSDEEEGEDAEVVDLLAALERSVKRRGGSGTTSSGTTRSGKSGNGSGSAKSGSGKSGSAKSGSAKSGSAKSGKSSGTTSSSKSGSTRAREKKTQTRKGA